MASKNKPGPKEKWLFNKNKAASTNTHRTRSVSLRTDKTTNMEDGPSPRESGGEASGMDGLDGMNGLDGIDNPNGKDNLPPPPDIDRDNLDNPVGLQTISQSTTPTVSLNPGIVPVNSTAGPAPHDTGNPGATSSTNNTSETSRFSPEKQKEDTEYEDILESIQTFKDLANNPPEDLSQVIRPNYDTIHERLIQFSDSIVLKELVPRFHPRITKALDMLAEAKSHLEHLARKNILRDKRKSSTLPLGDRTYTSLFARNLSETESEPHVFQESAGPLGGTSDIEIEEGEHEQEEYEYLEDPTTRDIISGIQNRLTNIEARSTTAHSQEYQHAIALFKTATGVATRHNERVNQTNTEIRASLASLSSRVTNLEQRPSPVSRTEVATMVSTEVQSMKQVILQDLLRLIEQQPPALLSQLQAKCLEHQTDSNARIATVSSDLTETTFKVDALVRQASATTRPTPSPNELDPRSSPAQSMMSEVSNPRISSAQSTRGQEFNKRRLEKLVDKLEKATKVEVHQDADISEVRKLHAVTAPKLAKVMENLNKLLQEYIKGDDFEPEFYQTCMDASDTTEAWIENIETLYDQLDVHTVDNEKNRSRIDVSIFTGDHKQTVHEFIEEFETANNNIGQSKCRANIMHKKYLSPMIRAQTVHASNDYPLLKAWLINRFGDALTVVDTLVASLECAKRPPSGAAKERLSYYLNISNVLMRLERMKTTAPVPAQEIEAHLHSRPVLARLISAIPDYDEPRFNDAIRAMGLDTHKPQGRYACQVYQDFVMAQSDNAQRALERAAKNPTTMAPQNPPRPKTKPNYSTQNVVAQATQPQPDPARTESDDEYAGYPAAALQINFPGGRWWTNGLSFPCPMAGHDHELSTCKEFFTLTPAERRNQALLTGRRLCWCCLRPTAICSKTCGRMLNISDTLKCPECAVEARAKGIAPLNLLYCVKQEHDSKKPPAQLLAKELRKYLKGMPKMGDDLIVYANFGFMSLNLSSCGCTVDACTHHLNTLTGTPNPDSDPPVIDTHTGERDYSGEHLMDAEPENDAFFLMQNIRIGDSDCLVLFDRGSNVNLISGPLAEQEDLQIISDKPSTIKIVGGEGISTQYGVYKLVLGSRETGYHTLVCHGMPQVTTEFNRYPLHEINEELRSTTTLIDPCDPLPPAAGGGPVKLLIGIKNVDLDPKFLTKLESGIGVYKSPFMDRYGSTICYGGSHPIFSRTNRATGNHATLAAMSSLSSLFTQGRKVISAARTAFTKTRVTTPEISPVLVDCLEATWDTTPIPRRDLVALGCALPTEHSPGDRDHPPVHYCTVLKAMIPISRMRQLIDQDDISDTVAYRCPDCSACTTCKRSNKDLASSVENSIGQVAIEKSVSIVDGKVWVDLPFIINPDEYLTKKHHGPNNYNQALRVYQSQCKKPDSTKDAMRAVHQDLVDLGFIQKLSSLPEDIQKLIKLAAFLHYMPWRGVEKVDSPSTPLRMVVDPTMTGLNSCLPKGENNLGKMNDIIIATRVTPYAWATDIRKMYNQLHLNPDSYRFQLMLYHESLALKESPEVWVMTRAWYGVTPTGNQSGSAVSTLVTENGQDFPKAVLPLTRRRFVDDVMSGGATKTERDEQIEHSKKVLAKGGFSLKYVIKSGEIPDEKATLDGTSVKLLGYKYAPVKDTLSLGFSELNMNKRVRGAKKPNETPVTTPEEAAELLQPMSLTRRQAMSKLAEFYDPIGIFEPLKLQYKLSLSQLNEYEWDQPLPTHLQEEWKANLAKLMELNKLEVPRCVIPTNEDNKPIRLICLSDAGALAGGAVVYAGVELPDGSFSCGMVAAKSKLMDATIPRNELSAIMLMTELAFIVKRAIGDRVTEIIYATDSAIALAWCHNLSIQLRLFVHNRVETIRRMIQWTLDSEDVPLYHINGTRNIADLVTKKHNIQISDVAVGSPWQTGPSWMKNPTKELPLKKYEEMKVNPMKQADIKKECYDEPFIMETKTTHQLLLREIPHEEENYLEAQPPSGTALNVKTIPARPAPPKDTRTPFLVDLVRLGWFRAIRVLSRILQWVDNLTHSTWQQTEPSTRCSLCTPTLKGNYIEKAELLIFQHETEMIKKSINKLKLSKYSEIDGVLTFSGRLAQENPFRFRDLDGVPFLDAPMITGPIPVVMAESEVFYAYLMAVHTKIAPHAGTVTTMREVSRKMFIPNGPKRLIKQIRQDCSRCKIILKKTIELEMQKHSFARTMIAPPFYNAMMDIAYGFPGQPFKKARASINVYALVIVCILTGATSIQALEGLETQDVVQGLERHARMHGVPAHIFIDNGTQLKALEHASFNVRDVHAQVYDNLGLEISVSTPKSHEERGRVERRIGLLRDMLERIVDPKIAQTPLQWQTLFAKIANTIDDLPIAKGDQSNACELGFEILTANRLKMGRNNNRSLAFPGIVLDMTSNLTSLLEKNRKIYQVWYQTFMDHIHLLARKPDKWNNTDRPPAEGDILMFILTDGGYGKKDLKWKLGRAVEVTKTTVKILSYTVAIPALKKKPKGSIFERNVRDVSILFALDELCINSREYHNAVSNEDQ